MQEKESGFNLQDEDREGRIKAKMPPGWRRYGLQDEDREASVVLHKSLYNKNQGIIVKQILKHYTRIKEGQRPAKGVACAEGTIR